MQSCGCHPDYHELGVHRPGCRTSRSRRSEVEQRGHVEGSWDADTERAFVLTYAG
jgi:hypothetical protein